MVVRRRPTVVIVVLIVVSILLALGSVGVIVEADGIATTIAGWAGLVFFGVSALAIVVYLITADPIVLTIDDVGVRPGNQKWRVDWPDVVAVFAVAEKDYDGSSTEYLAVQSRFETNPSDVARQRSAKLNIPVTAAEHLAMMDAGATPRLDDVLRHLATHTRQIPIYDLRRR